MQHLLRQIIWGTSLALLSVAMVMAQLDSCPELVSQALQAMEDNCSSTGRNQACYGYDQVEASFLVEVDDNFFSQPTDLVDVADVETIRTAPLSLENNSWGVALMNVQANLPNTLPGQNVTFILLGDVEVENAVAAEDAFVPSDGMSVTVSTEGNVRSGAGANFNVLGGVRVGDTLQADALSEDGLWLRVIFEDRPAWIDTAMVSDDVSSLPNLSAETNTPMQAFYLRTGIGQPECQEASESALLVQGPEDIEIELTVNGANIRLGSSGALRVVIQNGIPFLEIIVFDGVFEVDGITIEQGEHSFLCLGDEGSKGLDGESNDLTVTCAPTPPEPIDSSDFNNAWCLLEEIPVDVLNYALSSCYGSHTVANGENLFRIAQFYCTTVEELIALNGITNPNQLFVGQELILPLNACEGEGSTRPPNNGTNPPPPTTNNPSQTAGVDCSSFAIVPTQIIATNFTLSWAVAVGADEYEIAVFDTSGYQVSSTRTRATSIQMNGGESFPPSGYVDVRAYRAGAYACYTRLNFTRAADPNEPLPGFTASILSCGATGSDYKAVVSWQNAEGTPVTIRYNSMMTGTVTTTSNVANGQMNLFTGFSFYSFNFIRVSDGTSNIDLGGC